MGAAEGDLVTRSGQAQVFQQARVVVAQHHLRIRRADYLPHARRVRAAAEGVTGEEDAVTPLVGAGSAEELLELVGTSVYVTYEQDSHWTWGSAGE